MNSYSSSSNFEPSSSKHVFTSFPDSQEQELEQLLANDEMQQLNEEDLNSSGGGGGGGDKKYSIWQIEYYQKYFNVNTSDVLYRMLGSMTPTISQNYLINRIRPNPDLYGPFWITSTLIFSIAISGNIYSFLSNFGQSVQWHTNFNKVSASAVVILSYWWIMPTILYLLMRWRQNRTDFEFIELLCIYGYSLTIFIPVSVLWIIHVSSIQWILVILASLLSGLVLVFTLWPSFGQDENRKVGFFIMLGVLLVHSILGIGFMSF